MQTVAVEKLKLHIVLTNTARDAIKQHVPDEHALFSLQKAFVVFMEKLEHDGQQLHMTLYFDGDKNKGLQKQFPDRIVVMDCLFDAKSGLVAKSFRTRGKNTPVATNRRARLLVQFVPSRINGHSYPEKFLTELKNLPFSKERYEYVNKRITSWEGYLKVLNKNADFDDIDTQFSKHTFNADFTHITLCLPKVDGKHWKQLQDLSARVKGYHTDLGKVVKVKRADQTVEIELTNDMSRLARKGQLHFDYRDISFSNAATKSQLRRLLQGFERLKEGLAVNPNLEKMLFDYKITIRPTTRSLSLDFHNRLNEYQRAAVQGAMDTEDLYVIQGPPGTGKTTVISEICYQNAKLGLKTLVASQSNLAVDNALSRLLSNKDIRILRYGRTESIEEEGKKFIEENVGAYWKEQTYNAIAAEVEQHPEQETRIQEQLKALEQKVNELNGQIEEVKLQKEKQEEAKLTLKGVQRAIKELKSQIDEKSGELSDTMTQHDKLVANEKQLKEQYDAALAARNKCRDIPTIELELDEEKAKSNKLVLEQSFIAYKTSFESLKTRYEALQGQKQQLLPDDSHLHVREQEISTLKKVADVELYLEKHQIRRSFNMDSLLRALQVRQQELTRFKGIPEIYERLQKLEKEAEMLHIPFEPTVLSTQHNYSVEEVESFLNQLEGYFERKAINANNGQRSVLGLHLRRQYIENEMIQYQAFIQDTIVIFKKLKEELYRLFEEQKSVADDKILPLERDIAQTKAAMLEAEQNILVSTVTSERTKQEVDFDTYSTNQQIKALELELTSTKEKLAHFEVSNRQFNEISETIQASERAIDAITDTLNEIAAKRKVEEEQAQQLMELIDKPYPQLLDDLQTQCKKIDAEQNLLQEQLQKLPLVQELQKQWLTMLEQATEEDVDEIRKLYVKHANVIGTTCVTSANKEFMDNYPNFDVVIIDEVSKATPPELLLPMLKGAKIILVGDHHQLPPLIGDDTLEETLEQILKESDTFEEKRELEKLLEESLFERLYKNLGPDNKKMLAIQYRMHENIMQTITPFYKQEQDELTCGLEDSDAARDHMLEAKTLNRNNHLLWYDIPLDKQYSEQRLKEGASLFNEAELTVVKNLLMELNEATAVAIREGRIPEGTQKSVGVISYYAEQVKRINRLIEQDIQIPHLHIRTGSVDKFQGMEMDVIIVSMVRNHQDERGSIGFAKDYRRLNVALSRAREMLMLVGASELFTKRTKGKEVRQMYEHVLQTAKEQGGYRHCIEGGLIE